MTFAWPFVLPALLAVPVLLVAYWWLLRRAPAARRPVLERRPHPGRAPSRGAWRRHLPVALLLSALALLGLAAARPQVKADVPVSASSVILAVDVSGSMCATDVDPNRLSAAQDAVRDFVRRQDDGTRIGLVAFAGFAQLVVEPTTDHDELTNAIDSLTTGRGTAIGAAILKSVDAIAQINPDVPPTDLGLEPGAPGGPGGSGDPAPRAPNAPEIVVLLTDGANTLGIAPVEAARSAAERGVRVYPIGFGTTEPTMMVCTAEQLGGNLFENPGRRGGGGAVGGGGGPLVADEPTLRQVASITGGTFFAAGDADRLQEVLEDLPRHVQVQQREIEVSVWLAALAGLLVLLAVGGGAVERVPVLTPRYVVVRIATRPAGPRCDAGPMDVTTASAAVLTAAGGFFRVWAPHAAAVSVVVQDGPEWERWPPGHRMRSSARPATTGARRCPASRPGSSTGSGSPPTAASSRAARPGGPRRAQLRADPRDRRQPQRLGRPRTPDPFPWAPFDPPRFEDFLDLPVPRRHLRRPRRPARQPTGRRSRRSRASSATSARWASTASQPLPVHEFAMDRSWGYNPASFFAPESSYGSPADLRHFVDAAHRSGLAVIFDVVYNHAGTDDNVLWEFDGYTTTAASTSRAVRRPSGAAGPAWWKREVQDFFYQNARMYLEEYRADGLRFDVTTQINGEHLRIVVGPAAARLPRQVPHRRAPARPPVDRQRRAGSAPPGTPTPTTRRSGRSPARIRSTRSGACSAGTATTTPGTW